MVIVVFSNVLEGFVMSLGFWAPKTLGGVAWLHSG